MGSRQEDLYTRRQRDQDRSAWMEGVIRASQLNAGSLPLMDNERRRPGKDSHTPPGRSHIVPPPCRGGAVFGPAGQLVIFSSNTASTLAARSYEEPGSPPSAAQPPDLTPSPSIHPSSSSLVKIVDVSHLTLMHPRRSMATVGKAPLLVVQEAAAAATAAKDLLLAKVFHTLQDFLDGGLDAEDGEANVRMESLPAERLLQEMMRYLAHLRDVQTLGIVACLLEAYARDVEVNTRQREASAQPEDDYFSQQHPLAGKVEDGERTPLPTSAGLHRSETHSMSWANLSGFFNTSMLSLRSSSPSSPPSSDNLHPTRPPSRSAKSISPASSPGLMSAKSSLRSQHDLPSSFHRPTDASPEEERNVRVRSKTSPNVVTFGETSVAVIPNKSSLSDKYPEKVAPKKRVTVTYHSQASSIERPACWWLTDRALLELELIRLAYAELLFRWGLDLERAHVLKLCRSARSTQSGASIAAGMIREANGLGAATSIEMPPCCAHCGAYVRSGEEACTRCHRRQRAVPCILCHIPINGLTQSCSMCQHVGHLNCLELWFSANEACPTGCGCSCLSNGGTSGLFIVSQTRLARISTHAVIPPTSPNPNTDTLISPAAAAAAAILKKPARSPAPGWASLVPFSS
ncbi:hypothetical protein JCM11641_007655 [Rhodosporidiobolus odoratus]